MCVEHCQNLSSDGRGNCLQSPGAEWQIRNHQDKVVPDPLMLIDDPEHLDCVVPKSRFASSPEETKVIPPGSSPTWPSSGQPLALACDDFETCANELAIPIGVNLYDDDSTTAWGPGMGGADHLTTTSVASRSSLAITLENPAFAPSSEVGALEDGQFEYSAPDCGDLECPMYLANLSIGNTSTVWELYSHQLLDDIYIRDIHVQLRRPTLGVWNTSTGEFYLSEQRLDLIVAGSLQIGAGSPTVETYYVTNSAAIYGQLGDHGEVEIFDLHVDDSEFSLAAKLDYDTPATSPTAIDHGD
ncbi:hypothetical protein [Enhygromyxa salina]|nr:hypothetical protein [Enhygromyxa salina]